MSEPEGVTELVHEQLERGLPGQHDLVSPGGAVEAAVAVGDRVDDIVVARGVEAGAAGRDPRRRHN